MRLVVQNPARKINFSSSEYSCVVWKHSQKLIVRVWKTLTKRGDKIISADHILSTETRVRWKIYENYGFFIGFDGWQIRSELSTRRMFKTICMAAESNCSCGTATRATQNHAGFVARNRDDQLKTAHSKRRLFIRKSKVLDLRVLKISWKTDFVVSSFGCLPALLIAIPLGFSKDSQPLADRQNRKRLRGSETQQIYAKNFYPDLWNKIRRKGRSRRRKTNNFVKHLYFSDPKRCFLFQFRHKPKSWQIRFCREFRKIGLSAIFLLKKSKSTGNFDISKRFDET